MNLFVYLALFCAFIYNLPIHVQDGYRIFFEILLIEIGIAAVHFLSPEVSRLIVALFYLFILCP